METIKNALVRGHFYIFLPVLTKKLAEIIKIYEKTQIFVAIAE